MVCKKCKYTFEDSFRFCPICGADTQQDDSVCCNCGCVLESNHKFCSKCGTPVGSAGSVTQSNVANSPYRINDVKTVSNGGKTAKTYMVSVLSAIISLIIRLVNQETYYSYHNLMQNKKVLGLDSDIKPVLTLIPVIATIVVSLMIASDRETDSHKKAEAIIINLIFIALSLLFIWFDIPSNIFDL